MLKTQNKDSQTKNHNTENKELMSTTDQIPIMKPGGAPEGYSNIGSYMTSTVFLIVKLGKNIHYMLYYICQFICSSKLDKIVIDHPAMGLKQLVLFNFPIFRY